MAKRSNMKASVPAIREVKVCAASRWCGSHCSLRCGLPTRMGGVEAVRLGGHLDGRCLCDRNVRHALVRHARPRSARSQGPRKAMIVGIRCFALRIALASKSAR